MIAENILRNYMNNPERDDAPHWYPSETPSLTVSELIMLLQLFEDQDMEVALRNECGGTDTLSIESLKVDKCWDSEKANFATPENTKKYLFIKPY